MAMGLCLSAAGVLAETEPIVGNPPPSEIKAYSIDFNWALGGHRQFAKPGRWADADPEKHVAWYKAMGANVIQTFAVSCNGYAWYKNGSIPEQPGLKHDFLKEMVRVGHREGMQVMGYFCIGSNTRWAKEHPALSYGSPATRHIPYTDDYLAYLSTAITEAVTLTSIDGFMIDWFYQPERKVWKTSEKKLYAQLMNEAYPADGVLSKAKDVAYSRKAIARAWSVIHKAAKTVNPDCVIWLTAYDPTHPHIVNSRMLKEVDWLMNEAGDLDRLKAIKPMTGKNTRLITCLASWNKQDPTVVVPAALKAGIGLYGFAKPQADSLLPLTRLLAEPVSTLRGDEKNIAVLARAYHGVSPDALLNIEGQFVVPEK